MHFHKNFDGYSLAFVTTRDVPRWVLCTFSGEQIEAHRGRVTSAEAGQESRPRVQLLPSQLKGVCSQGRVHAGGHLRVGTSGNVAPWASPLPPPHPGSGTGCPQSLLLGGGACWEGEGCVYLNVIILGPGGSLTLPLHGAESLFSLCSSPCPTLCPGEDSVCPLRRQSSDRSIPSPSLSLLS